MKIAIKLIKFLLEFKFGLPCPFCYKDLYKFSFVINISEEIL